jgi:hypothetical protein
MLNLLKSKDGLELNRIAELFFANQRKKLKVKPNTPFLLSSGIEKRATSIWNAICRTRETILSIWSFSRIISTKLITFALPKLKIQFPVMIFHYLAIASLDLTATT